MITVANLRQIREAVAKAKAKKADASPVEFDFDTFDNAMAATEWETIPRKTLIRLFDECGYDKPFVFKVAPGKGAVYLNAMRQVISRLRRKADDQETETEEFKLLKEDLKHSAECDTLTLVLTQNLSLKRKSVYDEMLTFVRAEQDRK